MSPLPTPACCGTSKAAQLLQLSVGTVQSLVDKNILEAWVTQGGHRRISLESIHQYQAQQQKLPALTRLIENRLRIMVVDDDAVTRHMLQDACLSTHHNIDCCVMASGIESLLTLPTFLPHIVILDLLMPEVDGWEWVKRVKEKEGFEQMQIISISALSKDELEQRGGPPEGSHFISKPIDLGWLKGYLLGLMSPQAWV
jgi:excisionase family DNA binding protein